MHPITPACTLQAARTYIQVRGIGQRAGRMTADDQSGALPPLGQPRIRKGRLAVTTDQARHFALRYDRLMRAFTWGLGLGPSRSRVELSEDDLQVRMGWGFAARIPRRSIHQARRLGSPQEIWHAVGIHSLPGGRWIVNGSLHGVVRLAIEPPVRARALGLPIQLRWLAMSLKDPDGFLAALGAPTV